MHIIHVLLSSLILSLEPSPLPSLHLPLSLCVAYCETDGEGKDDRQTEGGRERVRGRKRQGREAGNYNQRVRDREAER